MKSCSKNLSFGVDFKLQVPLRMYKINTHNISGVRNQVNNPNYRVVMANYVCMSCLFVCLTIFTIKKSHEIVSFFNQIITNKVYSFFVFFLYLSLYLRKHFINEHTYIYQSASKCLYVCLLKCLQSFQYLSDVTN